MSAFLREASRRSPISDGDATIRALGRPGDLGWVVMAHGEVYAAEFGWNIDFEASVARIVGDLGVPQQGSGAGAWIAEVDGQRVGSIFCVPDGQDPTTGHLHGLLVTAAGRGRGIGQDLVDLAIAFARSSGYERLRLRTDTSLEAATGLYRRRGFLLIGKEAHRRFGSDLVTQTYELRLRKD